MVENVDEIVRKLTPLEVELLTEKATGWGSWMWGVSGDLIGKGLMYQRTPGHRDYTELGLAVRARLNSLEGEGGGD